MSARMEMVDQRFRGRIRELHCKNKAIRENKKKKFSGRKGVKIPSKNNIDGNAPLYFHPKTLIAPIGMPQAVKRDHRATNNLLYVCNESHKDRKSTRLNLHDTTSRKKWL